MNSQLTKSNWKLIKKGFKTENRVGSLLLFCEKRYKAPNNKNNDPNQPNINENTEPKEKDKRHAKVRKDPTILQKQ